MYLLFLSDAFHSTDLVMLHVNLCVLQEIRIARYHVLHSLIFMILGFQKWNTEI